MVVERDPRGALHAWFDDADAVTVAPLGGGHINDTWLVGEPGRQTVLQRINETVFPDPGAVADKVARVARLLDNAAVPAPGLRRTRAGMDRLELGGGVWRLWDYLADTRTLEPLENPAQAEAAGRAFGGFQAVLRETWPGDPAALADPIPGFMQLDHYLAELDAAVASAAAVDAATEALLAAIEPRRHLARALGARDRLIHGDCKVDNLLFRRSADEVAAIIDLDTVMHGHWAWDFGDLVRSAAAAADGFSMELFAALARGFVPAADVPADADTLVLAPRYVGLMLGVRFLTDHLRGDRYFKVAARGDNLQRARRQLALVTDMEARERAMRSAIRTAAVAG